MRTGIVFAKEFVDGDRRLNGGYYLSEDEEAMRAVRGWQGVSEALADLTVPGGVFSGGIFRIIEAATPQHGVPYTSARDLVQADIRPSSYISNAHGALLERLKLREGMILVTCSGMNLGKAIWTRSDMDGLCASGDLIRIIADNARVPGGYLYAFLSSRFGWVGLRKLIFGGNIKHIEPKAVARLLVPRLGRRKEELIHTRVLEAARLRSNATRELLDAAANFDQLISSVDLQQPSPRVSSVSSSKLQKRMEATYHDPIVARIRDIIKSAEHAKISDLCSDIFLPGIFKRIHIEDERFGVPYYTGASLYCSEPVAKAILSRRTSLFDQVVMQKGTILVQAFGQEGGLTGRPVWVGDYLAGRATTHMLARLVPNDTAHAGYLYAFLSSQAGYQQVKCLPFGGSIPHFDEKGIGSVLVPLLNRSVRSKINEDVLHALKSRDDAHEMEQSGRRMIEAAIIGNE